MKRVFAIAACAVLMGQAGPSQQFDLVCTGTRQEQLNGPMASLSQRIRIDLGANQYCYDACDTVLSIAHVTASSIVFVDRQEDTPRRRSSMRAEVNRVTGAYRNLWIEVRPIPTYWDTRTQCERAPFSGFPAARF